MSSEKFFIQEYRDLSADEVDLIKWILAEYSHLELSEQIKKTKVVSKCSCGCPTIDLQVEGYEQKSEGLMLSAEGFSSAKIPVGVILHVRNGLLSELEVYSKDGTKVFGLPEVDKLYLD